ncbi:MAG: sensor histidine kinase [Solirubrobacteraceae bacterium]
MTLRRRITLLVATAVAVSIATASGLAYLLVSNQLHTQVDRSLRDTARALARSIELLSRPGPPVPLALPPGAPAGEIARVLRPTSPGAPPAPPVQPQTPGSSLGQDRGALQLLGHHGRVLVAPGSGVARLPVDARARRLATQGGPSYMSETRIGSDRLRVLTAALPRGTPARAVQIARSLNEVDGTLANLRLILLLVAAGGIGVAALLGALVSRTTIAPIRRLSQATEHIARTHDLARRVSVRGDDELSRLAISFNAMLDSLERSVHALDSSVRAQRQLVADASHELRTPVTSLRANVEVLQQKQALAPEEHERLLCDVVEQTEDLTALIDDVIELARGDEPLAALEDVRLDRLVLEAIERALRNAPRALIEHRLHPTLVLGDPKRLDRAVSNLLDNARKFGPPGRPVEVGVHDGELTVRDHGPGIPAAEAAHVFDRFHRGSGARGTSGSGLGLAIVRQVAETHGGSVSAEPAAGGGALVRMRLPAIALDALAEQDIASAAPAS